jgi:DinB superfamily
MSTQLIRGASVILAAMPDQLERLYRAVPSGFERWQPPSWEGAPGETFTALEQVCHLRDIEVDGYQVRIRRVLTEAEPFLPSLDGYVLAKERRYADADASRALASFRAARMATLTLIAGLSEAELKRRGVFEGYGPVTLAGLIQYLCSHDQQHLACLHWLLGQIASS